MDGLAVRCIVCPVVSSIHCLVPVCRSAGQKGRVGRAWKTAHCWWDSDQTGGNLHRVTLVAGGWLDLFSCHTYMASEIHPSLPNSSVAFQIFRSFMGGGGVGTQTGAPASYPAKSPKLPGWLDVRPGLQVSERGVASGLGSMLKADGNSRYSSELLQFKAQHGPGYTPRWSVCTNSFLWLYTPVNGLEAGSWGGV